MNGSFTLIKGYDVSHIFIRPAKPSDAEFLAWAILTATRSHLHRGWFDIALDKSESSCLVFLKHLTVTKTQSHWHYSRFLLMEEGVRPVATLSAFRARDAYPVATAAIMETIKAIGLPATEAVSIWKRGAYMFRCTMRPDDECWVIENLATAPEFRKRGYTSTLLTHALDRGRAEGIEQAKICLFIGNESAERVYRNVGFRPEKERRDVHFESIAGAPGLRRYVRDL